MTFCKWLLKPLELYTPEFIKRMILCRLISLSAVSFQCPVPEVKGLSADELLKSYARFTEKVIRERLSQNIEHSTLQNRLYRNAFQAGQSLRGRFGLSDRDDVIRVMRFLYRIIKIDLQSDPRANGIIISQCFFSRYYSSEVCQIMASMDQGLAAGLSGGEGLEFRERITDGYEFCRAYWREKLSNDNERA